MTVSLQSMGLISLILLALTLSLSLRLGRHISTPLLQLRVWLRDPDDPAPGAGRQDEIGDIARQLQARLVPEKPQPAEDEFEEIDLDEDEADAFDVDDLHDDQSPVPRQNLRPAADDEDDDPFADLRDDYAPPAAVTPAVRQPGHSAILAVQLGAQEQLRHLPRTRLLDLLQRYRDCLEQAASLYQGKLYTLSDGSSLMLFGTQNSGADYLTHALCCGELLRALGHALQIEVADSGLTLQLQLGLTCGEELESPSQADLLLSELAQDALALSQHSRNLLLVQRHIAEDPLVRQRARIRAIASPEGSSCVERLLDPYPALLERQLARMHER